MNQRFLSLLFVLLSFAVSVPASAQSGFHAYLDYGFNDQITAKGNGNTIKYDVGDPLGIGAGYSSISEMQLGWMARLDILLNMNLDGYTVNGTHENFADPGAFTVVIPSIDATFGLVPNFYLFGGLNYSLGMSGNARSLNTEGNVGAQLGAGFTNDLGLFAEVEYRFLNYRFVREDLPGGNESYPNTSQSSLVLRTGYNF